MTGAEFRAQRTRAAVALENVAEVAGLPASTVAAWEGGARLSYLKRWKLNHALWVLERDLALAAPGAPACSVVSLRDPPPSGDKHARDRLLEHVQECENCKARGRYVSANVRPEPITGGLTLPLIGEVDRILNCRAPEPTGEPVRWSAVRANVTWGVTGGVVIGAGLCLMAALPVAAMLLMVLLTYLSQWSGVATSFFVPETAQLGPYILLVLPLYLAAGAVAGAIVGLLRPLARWRLGATLLGMIGGTILYWSVGPLAAVFTEIDPFSREHFTFSVFMGSLVGGVGVFSAWVPRNRGSGSAEA